MYAHVTCVRAVHVCELQSDEYCKFIHRSTENCPELICLLYKLKVIIMTHLKNI